MNKAAQVTDLCMKQNRLLLTKHIVHTTLNPASVFYFAADVSLSLRL